MSADAVVQKKEKSWDEKMESALFDLEIGINKVESAKDEIEDLKDERISDLENKIEELSESVDTSLLEKALEFYADPANWTGNTLSPVMPTIHLDPFDMARAALDGRPV